MQIFDLETVTDPISISGINGTLAAETKTSNIRFKDCAGTLSLRTHTGAVDLENVNGLIDVRNTIGIVNYSGSLATGSSAVRTTTGDINIALKGPQDLFVEASTCCWTHRLPRRSCRVEILSRAVCGAAYLGTNGNRQGAARARRNNWLDFHYIDLRTYLARIYRKKIFFPEYLPH